MNNFAQVENHEEIKVKQSKGGQLFIFLLAILMTAVSGFAVILGIPDENWFIVIVGVIGVLFFGFGIFVFLKNLLSRKYILVVNKDGFYDYSSTLSTNDTLIPWEQVKRIEIIRVTSELFIAVSLKNPEIAKEARTKYGNMIAKANKGLGYADVLITPKTAKGMNAEQMGSLMYEYWTIENGPMEEDSGQQELRDLDQL